MDKVCSLEQAAELVRDGDVVALQGGATGCTPMALVRTLIRQRRRDLHLVGLLPGLAFDWLAGAGVVAEATFAAVSLEHFGLCQQFRCGVEAGRIAVHEMSESTLLARLAAGARGVPFHPAKGLIGTDLIAESPDVLRVVEDPFGGPPVVACRALVPDVAVLHAQRADHRGNVALHPAVGHPVFTLLARASRTVVVTVEELVDSEELRRTPDRTILPGFAVDAVAVAPRGAHPTSHFPTYTYDDELFRSWVAAAATEEGTRDFLRTYVDDVEDHDRYLALVGSPRLESLGTEVTW